MLSQECQSNVSLVKCIYLRFVDDMYLGIYLKKTETIVWLWQSIFWVSMQQKENCYWTALWQAITYHAPNVEPEIHQRQRQAVAWCSSLSLSTVDSTTNQATCRLLRFEPLVVGRSKWDKPEEYLSSCAVWTDVPLLTETDKHSLVRGELPVDQSETSLRSSPPHAQYRWNMLRLAETEKHSLVRGTVHHGALQMPHRTPACLCL